MNAREMAEEITRYGPRAGRAERVAAALLAIFTVCDEADRHDTGHGHWVSTAHIRAVAEAASRRRRRSGLSVAESVLAREEETMDDQLEEFIVPGNQPVPNDVPGDHRLFPFRHGGWYCSGCVWTFPYKVDAGRARDVWAVVDAHLGEGTR